MLLWTRVSLGTLFAALAVAATALAWHSHRDRAAPPSPPPVVAEESQAGPEPQVQADDLQSDEHEDTDATPDEPADPAMATAGDVDDAWLPSGYVRKLSPEDATDLVTFVDSGLRGDGLAPAIEYRKGVVFAESEEDRGDDGPLPRSAPEGERVCGTRAVWMRQALEKTLANNPLTCSQNICWYGGMEYAPSGYLVFRKYATTEDEAAWALDAWIQVYDAGLPPKTAHHNENDILEIIDRLPKTCHGEPAGAY